LISRHLPSTSFANSSSSQSRALEWFQNDNFVISQEDLSDSRLLQRFALATAFYSFGRQVYLRQTDECGWESDWFEISCDSGSSIVSFDLVNYTQVTGSIPPELSVLTALTSLYLDGNFLTGSIPPQLSTLTALTKLGLGTNFLTGTIPPELSSLTALTTLGVGLNKLTGTIPSQLGALASMRSLYLYGNGLTGTIPSQLGALTLLEFLWLDYNELTGTVPSELCAIGIQTFWVDRDKVGCACCTCCV